MTPLSRTLLTPLYFIYKITALGGFLGALAGTFCIPVAATMVGGIWGAIGGFVIGAIVGIGLALLGIPLGLPGLLRYRKWLVRLGGLVGFLVYLVLPFVLGPIFIAIHIILLIYVVFSVVAGLATAYAIKNWFDWLIKKSPRKLKNEQLNAPAVQHPSSIERQLYDSIRDSMGWMFYLTPIVGFIASLISYHTILPNIVLFTPIVHIFVFGLVYTGLCAFYLLAMAMGLSFLMKCLILAANRLYFKADVHPLAYKNRLSVMAFFVTLFSTPIVTGFIGAPIAAIIATLAVRDYADWYNEASGKGKRKEKVKNAPSMSYQVDTVID